MTWAANYQQIGVFLGFPVITASANSPSDKADSSPGPVRFDRKGCHGVPPTPSGRERGGVALCTRLAVMDGSLVGLLAPTPRERAGRWVIGNTGASGVRQTRARCRYTV